MIEKRDPVWKPSFEELSTITPAFVETNFFSEKAGPKLKLLNRLSYYDYPHRTLSGLPTDRDVRRVINGDGKRGQVCIKPDSKAQVLKWMEQNWGRYDSSVIGEKDLPRKNNLTGGYSRRKIGMLEKVQEVLNRHVVEEKTGLKWK